MLTTTGAQFLKDTHGIEPAAVDSRLLDERAIEDRLRVEITNQKLRDGEEDADDRVYLAWAALNEIDRLRSALTARDDALASIRVFAQDCIENGHDRGQLGNLFSIRDLCDSKGETK